MGQAAVDLPDPLEPPPATSAAGTDDLLAQLAGEEIDRLLAEAEVERPSSTPGADDAPPTDDEAVGDVTTTVPVPPAAKADKPQAPAPNVPTNTPARSTAPITIAPTLAQPEQRELTPASKAAFAKSSQQGAAANVEALEAPQLGQVLRELEAEPSVRSSPPKSEESSATAAPATPAPAAEVEARVEAETVAAAAAVEQSLASQTPGLLAELEEEERLAKAAQAALAAPAGDTATATGDASADTSDDGAADVLDDDDEAAVSLPIYLKPLAWLNAPLDVCSDSVRQAIGKVAIITLVNAVAVLLYVLLFRRG